MCQHNYDRTIFPNKNYFTLSTAVLAAGAPEHAPFMADESMLAIPGLSPLQYTPAHYNRYAEQVKACVKRLNKEGKD